MPENKACFIDANIWLYAFTNNDMSKTKMAQSIIRANESILSTQVINEVCVNLIKKSNLTETQIGELIETFYKQYRVTELDKRVLLTASELRDEYSLSFWDSMIVAAAFITGAEILYSEDMQDGLIIRESLRIINPLK